MKKILSVIVSLILLSTLIAPAFATDENQGGMMDVPSVTASAAPGAEFVPTPEEEAASQSRPQSGTIAYDAVADTDLSANMLMTAALIVAAIALSVLVFTVIVLVTKKKRR